MSSKLIVLACLLAVSHSSVIDVWRANSYLGGRIIGGQDAQIGQFPHQVSLQWGSPSEIPFQHICGGSILSEQWILTAVHCLDAVDKLAGLGVFVVKAGKHDLSRIEDTEQTSVVKSYYKHPKYDSSLNNGVGPYDIGLIKLETPLRLTKRVVTIQLAAKDSEPTGQVILSGWGAINNDTKFPAYPTILQTIDLPILERKACNSAVEKIARENHQFLKYPVHETNVCTGPLTGGHSACGGDSGGPLIAKNKKGVYELVGVVSWGMIPCARIGGPSVYVKVASFIDWIAETRAKYSI